MKPDATTAHPPPSAEPLLPDAAMTEPRRPSRTAAPDRGAAGYLTIDELAAVTTLSVSTLRRLVKQGRLVGHQPGGPRHRVLFPPDAVERAAAAATPAAPAAPPPKVTTHPRRGPRPKWRAGS